MKMKSRHYILKDKIPVNVPFEEYVIWSMGDFEKNNRVADTMIGDVRVSTVFLGLDHSWDKGEPVLFETLVFGGELDGHMQRYCSWEAAEKGDKLVCDMVLSTFSLEEKALQKVIIEHLN